MATKKQLKSFTDAMIMAADIVKREDPDYLVAPMLGSVPLIDGMATATPDFDVSKVVYMPASSRILNVKDVIREWYTNFLDDIVDPKATNFPRIMGIDEVVSGQSVMRCIKNIDAVTERKKKGIRQDLIDRVHSSKNKLKTIETIRDIDSFTDNDYSFELSEIRERIKSGSYFGERDLRKKDSKFLVDILKKSLEEKLQYKTIGIEDSKKKGIRAPNYVSERENGRIFPVEIQTILTMDNPRYCPASFEEIENLIDSRGYVAFTPKIGSFNVSPEYIAFLRDIANYVGKNPDEVCPVNMGPILDSSKYLNSSKK